LLVTLALAALLSVATATVASASTTPSAGTPTGHVSTMTAAVSTSHRVAPDAFISGDCGSVNFINYGNGNFYVIVDSYRGAIWWVDWQVNSVTGSNSGTAWGNGSPHLEFGGNAGSGGPMVLTGDAFTSGTGYCYFIPNPA
jgi:hypothetical protein